MDTSHDPMREIVYLIRKLMRAGELYSKELDKKYKVSAPQLAALNVLLQGGAMPLSQIARQIMVDSSTLTGVIDRLEQKGLVSRLRNDADRRIIRIELTPAGQTLAEKAPPPVQMKIVKGIRKLEEAERWKIIEGLRKLAEMIDAQDLDVETELEVF